MRVGDGILATFKNPARSHQLGNKAGPRSSYRSVRHLNDKKKPDHWRAGKSEPLNELRLLAFATDSALQRLRLRPRHASLIGGDPRSSSGSLAKFTVIRGASSRVSRFGRRAVRRSDMFGLGEKRKCAACA